MRQATARTAAHSNAPASEDRSRTLQMLRASMARRGVTFLEPSPADHRATSLREALQEGFARGEALRIRNSPHGGGLTWAMTLAAERARLEGRWLLWIDGPRSFHAGVAARAGLPLERVLIGQLPSAASLFSLLEIAARSGVFGTLVIDAESSWAAGGGRLWSRLLPQLRQHASALIWLQETASQQGPALPWRLEPSTEGWTLHHQHRQEPLALTPNAHVPACLELYLPPRALPGRRLLVRRRHTNHRAASLAARSTPHPSPTLACAPVPDAS